MEAWKIFNSQQNNIKKSLIRFLALKFYGIKILLKINKILINFQFNNNNYNNINKNNNLTQEEEEEEEEKAWENVLLDEVQHFNKKAIK